MKSTHMLMIVVVLARCALGSRHMAKPAGDPRKLLFGRWQAVDLPPMHFSWDYQFRADGTGTQFYDNGGVMVNFQYVFDGQSLNISPDTNKGESSAPLRFFDADNFELAGKSLTVRFHRRTAEP